MPAMEQCTHTQTHTHMHTCTLQVGVVGFHNRWCRVRTYIEQGLVQSWQVLEYKPSL